jgi:hypothetical protein
LIVAVCLLAASCGSDPGAPGGVGCNFDTVSGKYLIHRVKTAGTCPEIPDVVATTSVGGIWSGCTVAKDEPSENGCRRDFDVTCTDSGETDRIVGYTRQRDESADRFDGLHTYYASVPSGSCVGTYDVTYTRQ